jgi:lipopolysaccharide transport system ATP-binding protein
MTDIAIRVENLSKQYRIGGPQARYKTIRESLVETVQAPFRRAAKLLRGQAYGAAEMDETIWALKDVSFEVQRGEVVGIIGRNGAGKTTLLKVLSRITEPTGGYAEIHGRVGSLLEVGSGFNPELIGQEHPGKGFICNLDKDR